MAGNGAACLSHINILKFHFFLYGLSYQFNIVLRDAGVGDKDLIPADLFVIPGVSPLHKEAGLFSKIPVFLSHVHGTVLIIYFNTRFNIQEIRSQSQDIAAPASGAHEFQSIQDKAGMDPALSLL